MEIGNLRGYDDEGDPRAIKKNMVVGGRHVERRER